MADNTSTLQSLVTQVQPLVQPAWPWGPMFLSDPAAYLTAASNWTSSPLGTTVPLMNAQQQFDVLVDQLDPPPPAGTPTPDAVKAALIAASTGSQADLSVALQQLAQQSWDDKFSILDSLAGTDGGGGQSYLETIEDETRNLPDVDGRVQAAMMVVLMNGSRRTISSLDVTIQLAQLLPVLAVNDQFALLTKLGISGVAAEGTIANLMAEAAALGKTAVPDAFKQIFEAALGTVKMGKWACPGNQPAAFYIGITAHEEIALYYRIKNQVHEPDFVETNTTPIGSLLLQFHAQATFKKNRLAVALAISRPDIFHWSLSHPEGAPGWIYEIKPWGSVALAEAEALFYASVLQLANVDTTLGPIGMPGTFGCVPAPAGWYVFSAVLPGALVYWYRKATKAEAEAAGEEVAPSPTLDKVTAGVEAAGATVALAPLVNAIIEALFADGWILAFLL